MRRRKNGFIRRSLDGGREVNPEEILLDAMNPADFNTDRLEGQIEYSLGRVPFLLWGALAAGGILMLLFRTGFLQVVHGEEYLKRAESNQVLTISLPAPRGILYDMHREALVKNTPSFEAILKRSELPDDPASRERIASVLEDVLGMSSSDLRDAGFDPLSSKETLSPEIILASDLPRDKVVELEAREAELPGVIVRNRTLREYSSGEALFHLIGYIGKSSTGKSGDALEGKSGLEAFYESELQGVPGEALIEINSSHTPIGELPARAPEIGKSLVLNIDAGLQQVLYASLKRELDAAGRTAGSAVVLDPRDGAVRALVSIPSLDPNSFRRRLSQDEYQRLLSSSANPFFNRAIAGEYPSGSVVKPMVAVAALEERVIDPSYKIYDPGSLSVPNPYLAGVNSVFLDWRPQGWVDMRSAIQWSANVYFYIIGGGYHDIKGLGITRLDNYMRRFGFGKTLGIDLPAEASGLVPGPDNIAQTRPRDPVWRLGDTYHTAIGQGSFQATPLQIAAMTAAVANGGTLWQPQIVRAVLDKDGNVVRTIEPKALVPRLGDPQSFEIVREGMRLVAQEGTARNFFANFPIEVAGKTGTAQTGFLKHAHGWFTSFAPYKNPELVTVVMAENAESSGIAPRVTREILYWYFVERHQQTALKNAE